MERQRHTDITLRSIEIHVAMMTIVASEARIANATSACIAGSVSVA